MQKLCYVAADVEAQMATKNPATCQVGEEGSFTLDDERFLAPEILFQPHLGGM